MKKLNTYLLSCILILGFALNIHAEGSGPTHGELASEFFTTNRSLPRDQRDEIFRSPEAAELKDALLAQDEIVSSGAQRFLTMWAPANMDDPGEAQAVLMAVVEKGGSPAARSTSAAFILRFWGTAELAQGWVDDGTLMVGHFPALQAWPSIQEEAYKRTLATGVLTGPYQKWFKDNLPADDAEAIEIMSEELRVLSVQPVSDARNNWIQELRTMRKIRQDLLD